MTGGEAGGRRPDRAAFAIALVLAALGVLLITEAGRIPDKAGYAGIGSGGVLWLIGGGLVLLALGTAAAGLRGGFVEVPAQKAGPVLWIAGGIVAQIVLVFWAGFTIGAGALFACTAAGFGERRFHVSVPAGLALGFLVYAVFDQVLKLNLPAGLPERLVFGN